MGGMGAPHRPVLLQETLNFLEPERGGLFVDCTVGLGGHSEAILQASSETRVLGIDRDLSALDYSRQRLAVFGGRFKAVHANFFDIAEVLRDSTRLPVRESWPGKREIYCQRKRVVVARKQAPRDRGPSRRHE